jgi:hypothetical protein
MRDLDDILAQINEAFASVPRPTNDDLLHPNCFDDNDIATLYEVRDWRDLSDKMVENEYAALAFLSPAGFRFFIPAYMSFSLRNPSGGAAAVESTLMSLSPDYDAHFTPSKFSEFNARQINVVLSFVELMAEFADVSVALAYWRNRTNSPSSEHLHI